MSKRWTDINESLESNRNLGVPTNFDAMDDMEADIAISEAIALAAEGKYIAVELLESVKGFNKRAADRDYDAFEYIAEAFSIGGFFKSIIDILAKFWGVIVNFFRALFKKIGGTDGTVKTLKALEAELVVLAKKDFKDVKKGDKDVAANIKFKDNDLDGAAAMSLALLDAKAYLEFPLKDDKTLLSITEAAIKTAASVETDEDGKKPEVKEGAAEVIEKTSKAIEDLIKEVGLGDKGAGTILLKMFDSNSAMKAALTDEKTKKVKEVTKVSEILKALTQSFFPKDAEVKTVDAKTRVGQLAGIVGTLLTGSGSLTSEKAASISKISLENQTRNGFDEAIKQAQDVLDKLKEAAKKIGAVKKSSFDTKDKDADKQEENLKNADTISTNMSKYSANLMEVQSSMQSIVTGGMDAGVAVLKAVVNEVQVQVKQISKLASGFDRTPKKDEE